MTTELTELGRQTATGEELARNWTINTLLNALTFRYRVAVAEERYAQDIALEQINDMGRALDERRPRGAAIDATDAFTVADMIGESVDRIKNSGRIADEHQLMIDEIMIVVYRDYGGTVQLKRVQWYAMDALALWFAWRHVAADRAAYGLRVAAALLFPSAASPAAAGPEDDDAWSALAASGQRRAVRARVAVENRARW